MPGVLIAEWRDVPDRAAALVRWRARRAQARERGANFWVFESATRPGQALEFTEARDPATLRLVCEAAGLPAPSDLLTEVELA